MSKVKIVIFGATGNVGRKVVAEALARGHQVTAVSRNPQKMEPQAGVIQVQGEVSDPASVAQVIAGSNAVISTVGPENMNKNPEVLETAIHSLLSGLERAKIVRLLVLGGTGTLEIAPGLLFMDNPEFPDFIKPVAQAHLRVLQILQNEAPTEIEWTYFTPGITQAGERTGKYRVGKDQLLVDQAGNPSVIAWEDMAVAMLDELEKPQHLRERITIAY